MDLELRDITEFDVDKGLRDYRVHGDIDFVDYACRVGSLVRMYDVLNKSKGNVHRDHTGRRSRDFCPDSWDECLDYGIKGWNEGLELVDDTADYEFISRGIATPEWRPDVSGEMIDMGRYMTGDPACFMSEQELDEESERGRIKRIAIGVNINYDVSKDMYGKRGAQVMNMVDLLEHAGFRLEVDLIAHSEVANSEFLVVTRGKDADQPLNREKMAFCMIHPGYFRRFASGARSLMRGGRTGFGRSNSVQRALERSGLEAEYDIVFDNEPRTMRRLAEMSDEDVREWIEERLEEFGVEMYK